MIIPDVNLLVYAHNAGAPQHAAARQWIENTFSGVEPVRIPWTVAHSFLRLTTDKRFVLAPFDATEVAAILDAWFASPAVEIIEPGIRYWPILRSLLVDGNIQGALISDAHLAALAIEHDATLCTADRDFRRFSGLRVINPLA
ncbi:MAG: TA system VapC family ribonuclease toxin [Thermoanaerobaculia bacterium]